MTPRRLVAEQATERREEGTIFEDERFFLGEFSSGFSQALHLRPKTPGQTRPACQIIPAHPPGGSGGRRIAECLQTDIDVGQDGEEMAALGCLSRSKPYPLHGTIAVRLHEL